MVVPNRDPEGAVAAARALYERDLKARLEPQENGKFVVVNVDTGEYELDEDDMAATRRAEARFGTGRLVTLRVGRPAAYRIGSTAADG